MESNIPTIRERNHQLRILYPAKLSFRYEGDIKTSRHAETESLPALEKMLKGARLPEKEKKIEKRIQN